MNCLLSYFACRRKFHVSNKVSNYRGLLFKKQDKITEVCCLKSMIKLCQFSQQSHRQLQCSLLSKPDSVWGKAEATRLHFHNDPFVVPHRCYKVKNKDAPFVFENTDQAPWVRHHAGTGRTRHGPCPPKIHGWPFSSHTVR